jgi:hypothetical protein
VRSTRAQSKGKRKRKAETIILEKPSLHCKGGTAYKKGNLFEVQIFKQVEFCC